MQKPTTKKQHRARKVRIKDLDNKADPKGGPSPTFINILGHAKSPTAGR